MCGWRRGAGQRGLVWRQHALRHAGEEVAAVLLQVEVGGDGLLHRQPVQVALLGFNGRTLADLEMQIQKRAERQKSNQSR